MTFSLTLLMVVFAVVTCSAIASNMIVFGMVRRINRKRGKAEQLGYVRSSWSMVSREYKVEYPDGKLPRALLVAVWLTGIFFVAAIILLFTVLPKYTFPSH